MKSVHKLKPLLIAATVVGAFALSGCRRADTPQALIESGKQLDAKGDFRAAVIQYKAALQLAPESAEARVLVGRSLVETGDPSGAAVEFAKALELKAAPEQVVPPLARALLQAGDARKLITQFGDTTLTDKTAQADLKASLARAYAALGDKQRSASAVSDALLAGPESPAAQTLNASLMAGRKEYDKALAVIEQVLARDPKHYEAWMLRGEIELAAHNDKKAAEAAFRKVLEIERRYIPAHAALVTLLIGSGDVAAAKLQATQLRELMPGQAQSLFIDALIAYTEHDLPKARELIQQVLRQTPDNVTVLHLAGVIEGQLGSLVMAENFLSKALSLEPAATGVRTNLASVFVAVGQAGKALETLAPLLGPASTSGEANATAGEAYLQLGDARAAEERFKQASALNPADLRSRTSVAMTRLNRGDANGAFAELGTLVLSSKEISADLALISARLGRAEYPAALAAIDTLDKKEPNSARSAELRGRVLWAMKDYVAARASFEKALKIDPSLFAAAAQLVDLDLLEKKPDAARLRLEAAIAADPRNHYARLKLANLRANAGADVNELRGLLNEAIKAAPTAAEPRLLLIELLLNKRLYKDVQAVAAEAASTFGNDPKVLDAVGRAEMSAGNVERAISTFRKLAGLVPGSAAPYLRLASAYATTGQRESIETALKKALEVEPGSRQAVLAYADFASTNNQFPSGLAFARDLQKKSPTASGGYLLEAAVLSRQKSSEDSGLGALKKGLAAVKAPSEIAQQLYATELKLGHTAEADRFATEWLKTHPDDMVMSTEVAAAETLRGLLPQAQSRLEAVVAKQPRYVPALNNLAEVLVRRGKPGAVAVAQQAADLAPNQAAVMDTLASALAADKRFAEAVTAQKKAVELAPGRSGLRLTLARIALQAGDKATAKAELERLRALGSGFGEQSKVLEMLKAL